MANDLATKGTNAIMTSQQISEVIETNLGGQLDISMLDRTKVPSGGGTSWVVPTIDGDEDVKTIEGVLIFRKRQNAYWPSGMEDTGSTPPQCTSRDGAYGLGNPGGQCASCPLNAFGSKGEGKACKNSMLLFVKQENAILPLVVQLPPTSITIATKYLMRLSSAGVKYYEIISQLSLVKTKNDSGIAYSVLDIKPKKDAAGKMLRLSAEEVTGVEDYRNALLPSLQAIHTEATEAIVEE